MFQQKTVIQARKTMCFFMTIVIASMIWCFFAPQNAHAATVDYTLTVGETRTIYANVRGYNIVSGTGYWTSNSPDVSIISQSAYAHSCTIRANSSTGNIYAYVEYRFSYKTSSGLYATGMKGYKVKVTEPEAYYSVNISPSSFTLDLAGTNYKYASIDFTIRNSPYSSFAWGVTSNTSENYCDLYTTDDEDLYFEGVKPGNETLTFYLKPSNSNTILAQKNVYVTVKCSHSYGEGVCTKNPTNSQKGTKQYTCSCCGNVKTEDIPAPGCGVVKTKSVNTACNKGVFTADIALESNTKGCVSYVALYDSQNCLKHIFTKSLAANELRFSFNEKVTDGNYTVKVFFWDAENQMIPLADCVKTDTAGSDIISEASIMLSVEESMNRNDEESMSYSIGNKIGLADVTALCDVTEDDSAPNKKIFVRCQADEYR